MAITNVPASAYDASLTTPVSLDVAYGTQSSTLNLKISDCRTAEFVFPTSLAFGENWSIDLFRAPSGDPPIGGHIDAASYTADCASDTHKMTLTLGT